MPEQFYSEDHTDEWCAQVLNLPSNGKFVDVGCGSPFRFSQTAWLRNRGWTGLCIDGDYSYEPEWTGVRNATFVNAIVHPEAQVYWLREPSNSMVSRIHPEGELTDSYKLSEIMESNGFADCDFMALDIEGSEAINLEEIFEAGIKPGVIVVEFHSEHKGRCPDVFNLLIGTAGYTLRHLSDNNAVFTR